MVVFGQAPVARLPVLVEVLEDVERVLDECPHRGFRFFQGQQGLFPRPVLHSFPHLKLYLRAHSRLEAYEFLDMGEEKIYRETLESSMAMSVDIMSDLGIPHQKAERIAKRYRENDERMIREMAKPRHDEKEYIGRAKEFVKILDELMRRDMDEIPTRKAL